MSRAEFEFTVAADHPSLPGHFPSHPIVPGVVLVDCVLEALTQASGQAATQLRQVKFLSPLLPDERAQGWWDIDGDAASFRLSVQRDGVSVKVAEGAITLAKAMAP